MATYLVATVKSWNIEAFQKYTADLPGNWQLITSREQLTRDYLAELKPTYIFFPHWNWKVPADITGRYCCVCFHMTDLPFGRGGSPLQNLILSGATETKLTALQMTEHLDAGPIFGKLPLSLAGTATDIFQRAAPLVYQLISQIISQQLSALPQQGDATYFDRRSPAQSKLPEGMTAARLYDFIRMLDGEGYPAAYIEYNGWRLEFSAAALDNDGQLSANVRFLPASSSGGEQV
ncbi:hypothetical protein [Arsukibacterium indicum]|uniref:Methionyl-tRNA formyltransferase-like C-terminal domain-containing protein n=1 Tax=Arsukibacterium indicum TaxID=2848612 RepID=A0ABS6MGF4_9GAMM|nr:hypothetical protein [Arsukibacterium indicum]MBV2127868.1 hypothetical protein [Arsukibacterium indicum]